MTVLELTAALLPVDEECNDITDEEIPDAVDDVYIKTELLELCASLVEKPGDQGLLTP